MSIMLQDCPPKQQSTAFHYSLAKIPFCHRDEEKSGYRVKEGGEKGEKIKEDNRSFPSFFLV